MCASFPILKIIYGISLFGCPFLRNEIQVQYFARIKIKFNIIKIFYIDLLLWCLFIISSCFFVSRLPSQKRTMIARENQTKENHVGENPFFNRFFYASNWRKYYFQCYYTIRLNIILVNFCRFSLSARISIQINVIIPPNSSSSSNSDSQDQIEWKCVPFFYDMSLK